MFIAIISTHIGFRSNFTRTSSRLHDETTDAIANSLYTRYHKGSLSDEGAVY